MRRPTNEDAEPAERGRDHGGRRMVVRGPAQATRQGHRDCKAGWRVCAVRRRIRCRPSANCTDSSGEWNPMVREMVRSSSSLMISRSSISTANGSQMTTWQIWKRSPACAGFTSMARRSRMRVLLISRACQGWKSLNCARPRSAMRVFATLHDCLDSRALYLYETRVGDAGMAFLARLRNLEELSLGNTAVGDAGLAQLAGLTG